MPDFYDGMYEAGFDDPLDYMEALECEYESYSSQDDGISDSQCSPPVEENPSPVTIYRDYLASLYYKSEGYTNVKYSVERIHDMNGEECLVVCVSGVSDDGNTEFNHVYWPHYDSTAEELDSFPRELDDFIIRIWCYSDYRSLSVNGRKGAGVEWLFGFVGKQRLSLTGGVRHSHNVVPCLQDNAFSLECFFASNPEELKPEDADSFWVDQYGAVYSSDRLRLLSFPLLNQTKRQVYHVLSGTICICEEAFSLYKRTRLSVHGPLFSILDNESILSEVIIPDSVLIIGKRAFRHCQSLKTIVIPSGVTKIEDETFEHCRSLEKIEIKGRITRIGQRAFSGASLTAINLPSSVSIIGKEAFRSCHFSSVTVPGAVKVIEEGTFVYCSKLKTITIGEGVESMKKDSIALCWSLERIDLPQSLKEIEDGGCSNNASLKELYLPDSLERIGTYAFSSSQSLETVRIPASLNYIGSGAFYNCRHLKKILIPKGFLSGEGEINQAQIYLGNYLYTNHLIHSIEEYQ